MSDIAICMASLLDEHHIAGRVVNETIKVHDISHDISVTRVLQDILELCVEL